MREGERERAAERQELVPRLSIAAAASGLTLVRAQVGERGAVLSRAPLAYARPAARARPPAPARSHARSFSAMSSVNELPWCRRRRLAAFCKHSTSSSSSSTIYTQLSSSYFRTPPPPTTNRESASRRHEPRSRPSDRGRFQFKRLFRSISPQKEREPEPGGTQSAGRAHPLCSLTQPRSL